MSLPWTELYRPKSVSDLVLSDEIKRKVPSILENGNQHSHLLITGSAGVGKTSFVHVLISEWYPNVQDQKLMVLELNASDDCGIDAIRHRVLTFFGQKRVPGQAKHNMSRKIIVLDEADRLTPDAQTALRCPLEENSAHTLVILLGNHFHSFVSAIVSRTLHLIFSTPSLEQLSKHLFETILIRESKGQQELETKNSPSTNSYSAFLNRVATDQAFHQQFLSDLHTLDIRESLKRLHPLCELMFYCYTPESSSLLPLYLNKMAWMQTQPRVEDVDAWIALSTSVRRKIKVDSVSHSCELIRNFIDGSETRDSIDSTDPVRYIHEWTRYAELQGYTQAGWIDVLFRWLQTRTLVISLTHFCDCTIMLHDALEKSFSGCNFYSTLAPCFLVLYENACQ